MISRLCDVINISAASFPGFFAKSNQNVHSGAIILGKRVKLNVLSFFVQEKNGKKPKREKLDRKRDLP